MIVPPRVERGGLRPAARPALGWAVALAAMALGGAISRHAPMPPPLLPAAAAAAFVATFQVAGAVAGRGRPIPGARLGPGVRAALAIALAVWGFAEMRGTFLQPGAFPSFDPSSWLSRALGFVALCEVASRLGGPSGAVLATLYAAFSMAPELSRGDGAAVLLAWIMIGFLAALGATRRYGLDRKRLRRVGVTPWSPAELGLAPIALSGLGLTALAAAGLPRVASAEVAKAILLLLSALFSLALAMALRYLDRRLRAAEALAAERARAARGEAPATP